MRKIESEMNRAIASGKNFSKDNTKVVHNGSVVEVYLYNNKIAEISDGRIVLYDGGKRSKTTKSRLNAILEGNSILGDRVYQENFTWYLWDSKTQSAEYFYSGIILED